MAPSSPRVYARRKPEEDPLHQVLSQHLLTFLDQAEQDPESAGLPAFVKKETASPDLWDRALQCPRCEGKMKVVAVVLEPAEGERLCANLGQATEAPPVQPSRYRRQMQLEFGEPP